MKTVAWIAALAVAGLAACNYTEGQCYPRGQGPGDGAGGGGVVPGGPGGFGDVPPEPQEAGEPPPPDCNRVQDSPCNEKCLANYENAAMDCAKIADETQKRTCDDSAYAGYKNCRENCQQAFNACKDKCDEKATEQHKICEGMTDGPGKAKCRQAVEEQRGDCYRECDKK